MIPEDGKEKERALVGLGMIARRVEATKQARNDAIIRCRERGATMAEIADHAGISPQAVSKFLKKNNAT